MQGRSARRIKVRSKGHSSNDLVLNEGGAILLMQGMDQILDVDEEGLTATVQGGAISALIDDHLAPLGLGLPIIGDHRDITVGGFASVGGISPASHRFGMFIDNVLAIQFVDWDGEIKRCSPDENADDFYSLLAGLGRHGVIVEVTLRLIRIDKYRTIWENHQTHYRSMDDFIAGTKPIIEEPGDVMMERGVWVDFKLGGGKHLGLGQFSEYRETSQTAVHKARNTGSYGVLHGIGRVAGNLPEKLDMALKYVGMGGVMLSPKYASIKNIEFFTDKVLDSTVGDPTRMLIVLGPLDKYEELFRRCWALLDGYRESHGCFTFLSVYVKSIRSDYLARDGYDRFCELMFYTGVHPDRMTTELLDEIVEQFDDIVIDCNGYKYMHTRTTKDPEKRAKVDPNARHAERRRAATNGKGELAVEAGDTKLSGEHIVKREIPLYTLEGVIDCDVTTHYFSTEDGLGLSMLRFNRDPKNESGDSIMIVHGLTTSTDMFIMPEHYNLVSFLLDNGYTDVWCLDMRMSNRHSYNLFPHRYTFDDIALYDYPPAIDIIRRHVGPDRRLHVIAHCLGSVTFMMSLFGKASTGITSLVANSVGLTPRVPKWSKLKLRNAPGIIENVLGFPNLNPRWHQDAGLTRGKLFSKGVSFFHRECDEPACHMLSLMWGTGWPALYSARQPRRRHAPPRRRPLRRDEHELLPERLQDAPGRQPPGEVRARQARAGRAARRLLRVRARDQDARPADDRRGQQGLRRLEHRLLRAPARRSAATTTSSRSTPATGTRTCSWARTSRATASRRCSTSSAAIRSRRRSRQRSSGQPPDQDRDRHQRPRGARVGGDDGLRVVPVVEPVRAGGVRTPGARRAAEDPAAAGPHEDDLQAARDRRRAGPRAAVAGDPRAAGRVRRRPRLSDRAP